MGAAHGVDPCKIARAGNAVQVKLQFQQQLGRDIMKISGDAATFLILGLKNRQSQIAGSAGTMDVRKCAVVAKILNESIQFAYRHEIPL